MEAQQLQTSDGQLVAKAVGGDDSAFDELVWRYRTRVYHLALSKVRGRENALDIAQEAFVQAYLSLKTLREPEKFSAWLSGITSNLCRMHFRKASELPIATEMIEDLGTPAEPDKKVELAREALDQLPNGTRSAAILYFVEEMKQTEIAEFLGISLAAVKSRIRDARASLQKEMIHMVKQTAKKEEPGDEFTESLKHRLELARWYREFSEMIYAGTTIMRALDKLRHNNYPQPMRRDSTAMMNAIERGATLGEALEACPALQTPEALHLIHAGEHGGMLELTSRSLVDFLELRSIQDNMEIAILCRTIGGLLLGRNELAMVLKHAVEIAQSGFTRQVTRKMLESVEAGGTLTTVVARYSESAANAYVESDRGRREIRHSRICFELGGGPDYRSRSPHSGITQALSGVDQRGRLRLAQSHIPCGVGGGHSAGIGPVKHASQPASPPPRESPSSCRLSSRCPSRRCRALCRDRRRFAGLAGRAWP